VEIDSRENVQSVGRDRCHLDDAHNWVYSPLSEVSMIVEVRSYRIKPGHRAEFIKLFESRAVPALRQYGMQIVGPLLDVENPNKFVFLRSFPSLDERDRMKDAFYRSELWKNELERIAMPLLDSYDVILCETSPGCVFDWQM
jgi:heme-degrading monooxygenase HmoA